MDLMTKSVQGKSCSRNAYIHLTTLNRITKLTTNSKLLLTTPSSNPPAYTPLVAMCRERPFCTWNTLELETRDVLPGLRRGDAVGNQLCKARKDDGTRTIGSRTRAASEPPYCSNCD